jgi:hypothetical protein
MNRVKEDLQLYEHVPDANIKHAKGFNNDRYLSIQDRVNADPDFEVKYIDKLDENGWIKLANNSDILRDDLKGRHFKYRLNGKSISNAEKGTFRSGGMVVGMKNGDPNFILYKAYNGCIFSLQLSDIEVIYMRDPNKKIAGNNKEKQILKTVYFDDPKNATIYPVYLKSRLTGEDVIVYYAKDNNKKERFMNTKKFIYAYETSDWDFRIVA